MRETFKVRQGVESNQNGSNDMLTYEQSKAAAISNTIPDGKVYCVGDAGSFYVFIVVPKDFDTEISNPLIGSTYTAVDKKDGRVWSCHVTDPRLKNAKRVSG